MSEESLKCSKCLRVCKDKKGLSKHYNLCSVKNVQTPATNNVINAIDKHAPVPGIVLQSENQKRGRGRPRKDGSKSEQTPVLATVFNKHNINLDSSSIIRPKIPSKKEVMSQSKPKEEQKARIEGLQEKEQTEELSLADADSATLRQIISNLSEEFSKLSAVYEKRCNEINLLHRIVIGLQFENSQLLQLVENFKEKNKTNDTDLQ